MAEMRRNTAVQERAAKTRRVPGPGIPGVRAAVAVVVTEVVRLPGLRRQDDGDPVLAKALWPEHERRECDNAVGRTQPREVQPARPVSDPDREGAARRPRAYPPAAVNRNPPQHVARAGASLLRPGAQD